MDDVAGTGLSRCSYASPCQRMLKIRGFKLRVDNVAGNVILPLPAYRNAAAEVCTHGAIIGDQLRALGPGRRGGAGPIEVACVDICRTAERSHGVAAQVEWEAELESTVVYHTTSISNDQNPALQIE